MLIGVIEDLIRILLLKQLYLN